jgi:hypothetical protein
MTMKIGVEGRIITGPAGAPGDISVPLRMAVVHEGVNPKTVLSKLYRVPVTVAATVDRVTFTEVDPEVAFPMPPGGQIDAYVVYVGFDPQGDITPKKPAKPKGKPKPKAAPKPKAPAVRAAPQWPSG